MDEQRNPTTGQGRPAPTTTHAAWGAGHPRLLISSDDERRVYDFIGPVTRIGSGADCEVRLAGADPAHATIEHDDRDEFVLTMHGEGEMNANPGTDAPHPGERSETLRTGARFTAGPWTLVFQRDEFADHGRPFGGRQGGELSDQPQQPPRPEYDAGVPADPAAEPEHRPR